MGNPHPDYLITGECIRDVETARLRKVRAGYDVINWISLTPNIEAIDCELQRREEDNLCLNL